jgi:phospholipid/cholesterol/gamma-HCH transport system permease protein
MSALGDVSVRAVDRTMVVLAQFGDFGTFVVNAIGGLLTTFRRYRDETLRQLMDIAWGSGALVVGGGTIGIMVLLSLSAGTSLGIQGFTGLQLVGLSPLTGFISASANTRELAPLIAALALGAQIGCRFTAQLGSMKISEEVDALAVMGINPMSYLVSTRVLATVFAILPLYLIGLIGSYLSSFASVVLIFHQSPGQYQHYFSTFIQDKDIWYSVIKIIVFAVAIALIHCWYGMGVGGGPQAVGEATGRAIRASIVTIVVLDMIMTLVMWGGDSGFRVSG